MNKGKEKLTPINEGRSRRKDFSNSKPVENKSSSKRDSPDKDMSDYGSDNEDANEESKSYGSDLDKDDKNQLA